MSSTTGSTKQYSDLTPYRAAQVLTVQLRKLGLIEPDEEIAPQTMYSNKSIKRVGTKKSEGGAGIMFDGDAFMDYLRNEVAARRSGGRVRASVNIDRLAAEFDVDTEAPADQPVADEDVHTATASGPAADPINETSGPLTDSTDAVVEDSKTDEDSLSEDDLDAE
jgi:hypothetical protein